MLYAAEAARCRARCAALRRARNAATDAGERARLSFALRREEDVLTQCNELHELCVRYYAPDYYRNPKYTLQEVVFYEHDV